MCLVKKKNKKIEWEEEKKKKKTKGRGSTLHQSLPGSRAPALVTGLRQECGFTTRFSSTLAQPQERACSNAKAFYSKLAK